MQTFPCKHEEVLADGTVEKCAKQVQYADARIVLHSRPMAARSRKKRVYLECDSGHSYPYEVIDDEE